MKRVKCTVAGDGAVGRGCDLPGEPGEEVCGRKLPDCTRGREGRAESGAAAEAAGDADGRRGGAAAAGVARAAPRALGLDDTDLPRRHELPGVSVRAGGWESEIECVDLVCSAAWELAGGTTLHCFTQDTSD